MSLCVAESGGTRSDLRAYIGLELKQGYVVLQILYMNGLHISALLGLPYKQAIISNFVCASMLVVMVLGSPFDM